MGSVFYAEFSLNIAHCMHVGQTYIMLCVSIETRLWKAELKKTVDKSCCYILNNRYPRCEWSSLAFVLHVLLCSTRVISVLGGLYFSMNNILFCIQNVVKYLSYSLHLSFICPFFHSFIHSPVFLGNFFYSFIPLFTLSFIFHQCNHSFIYSFKYSPFIP